MARKKFRLPVYEWPDEEVPLHERLTARDGEKIRPEQPAHRTLHDWMTKGIRFQDSEGNEYFFKIPTKRAPRYRYSTLHAIGWWKHHLTLLDQEFNL